MLKDSRKYIKLASRNPKITVLTIIGYGASEELLNSTCYVLSVLIQMERILRLQRW